MKPEVHVRIKRIIVHSLDIGDREAFTRAVIEAVESRLVCERGNTSVAGSEAWPIPSRIGAAVSEAFHETLTVGGRSQAR